MYKQVIVVNKDLNLSKGKMAVQVSHASMAFLSHMIQRHTTKRVDNRYPVWNVENGNRTPLFYKRIDLDTWAREARIRGEDYFFALPVNPAEPYGELKLCDYCYHYETHMVIDTDLYEKWMGGSFTKVILEAKNETQMQKIIEKAKEAGMIEGESFFCIRDNCLTELTPDETGTRWTCIGFAPMEAEKIDKITKKLQLDKG